LYTEIDAVYKSNEDSEKERKKLVDQMNQLNFQVTQLTSQSVNLTIQIDTLTTEKQLNQARIQLLEEKIVTLTTLNYETTNQLDQTTQLMGNSESQIKQKDEIIGELRSLLDVATRREKELTDEKDHMQKVI
jgi:chromosome segregation ATPase